ncbi:hypothetical protein G4Z16_11640 [Streptomyces bathyalis]|uniref:Uncharacterized protein n=1 Tax=Streptomyces bathyalis TaxID=2710756 RepID=A0A7T1T5V2_9ACTN|nr:hypothetical protein [Streptomyces bathyalis]QPP06929.1 hypothetical protein G4Z16_11640 [Streptomyces bathyalis]
MPAAVRLPRPAAARRALLTFLFLGGFLALAFVFGGSAQAASGSGHDVRDAGGASSPLVKSGTPSGPDAGSTASKAGKEKAGHALTKAELAAKHRREVRDATGRTASDVVSPVAEGASRTGEVTRPVGEAVESASGPSGLGGLPGRLGLGVGEAIAGDGSGGADGCAGDVGTDGASGATADGAGDRTDGQGTHGSRALAFSASYPGAAAATAEDGISQNDGDPADRLPFHRTPAVPAPSASQYTGDGQGQRGGPHQHDAVVPGTEHLGPLQSGAVRAADGTPTRDSAGDVLEFPG